MFQTFVISFFFLAVFGTSMIVSAFYFEAAAIALFLICTVDMYVHSITAYQWKEVILWSRVFCETLLLQIKKCPRLIVAVSAPLTLLGVVATGLFLTIEPKLALPCGLFLLYAIVCLSVGLCESKAIVSNFRLNFPWTIRIDLTSEKQCHGSHNSNSTACKYNIGIRQLFSRSALESCCFPCNCLLSTAAHFHRFQHQ